MKKYWYYVWEGQNKDRTVNKQGMGLQSGSLLSYFSVIQAINYIKKTNDLESCVITFFKRISKKEALLIRG